MCRGIGEVEHGKQVAGQKSKSYKGAATLGSNNGGGVKPAVFLDKWCSRGVTSLRPRLESSKMVRRPLFQNTHKGSLETETADTLAAVPEAAASSEHSAEPEGQPEGVADLADAEASLGDGIELSLSEEEVVNEARDVDCEQEDTLLYTEEDLLEDMAFCAVVANVDTMTESDRIRINEEFEQTLKKCRVTEQAKQPAGPTILSSKNNTPIRGVRFKKALEMKAMSPRKIPKNKGVKESTTRDKDKSSMKF